MASLFNTLFPPQVGGSLGEAATPQELLQRYHARTKHQLQAYAAGPETLDWDAQPNPFRSWPGAPRSLLPLAAQDLPVTWQDLRRGRVPPVAMDRTGVALLLELSLAITAWKQLGPDRWALRANPSSGNLHPTEAYVLAQAVPGLPDGLGHYEPRDHALAWRAAGRLQGWPEGARGLWIGLSSVEWREAWKYGERAFRYCQLDTGHALAAVRMAAAVLGWQARWLPGLDHAVLAATLGLDRDADFGSAEREEPEGWLALFAPDDATGPAALDAHAQALRAGWRGDTVWMGQASRLDARPLYRWPVIDEVSRASRSQGTAHPASVAPVTAAQRRTDAESLGSAPRDSESASRILRERRSAQHFDRRAVMSRDAFARLLASLLPGHTASSGLPWDAWPWAPRVHLVVYPHRVEGVKPGACVLPRSAAGRTLLQAQWSQGGTALAPEPGWTDTLPLMRLAEHPTLGGTVRTLSCHQAIGGDSCVAFSLLAEWDEPLSRDPAAYRELLQEAGLIGQMLYLQAEAEGLRGTGIGCYFDDAVHELLGLQGQHLQVLYHFTVGAPMVDSRLQSEPAYTPERQALDTGFDAPLPPSMHEGTRP